MTRFSGRSLLTCALLFVLACNSSREGKDIIAREKMGNLLTDLVVAEEYAKSKVAKDSSLSVQQETLKLYAQVLELHKTTRQDFLKSFDYYISRPEVARALFDSLSVRVRSNFNQQVQKPQ